MIVERTHTYLYHCWKCKQRCKVEQIDTDEIMDLECSNCGKTLMRVNRAPGLDTDTTFMAGSHADDGFGNVKWLREKAIAKAKAAGVDVNGARYCPQLNAKGESLSPKAWVRDKADVKRRCQELGMGCQGSVNVQAPEREPAPEKPYRIAEDILDREMRTLTAGKGLSAKETLDLREKTAKRLSGEK